MSGWFQALHSIPAFKEENPEIRIRQDAMIIIGSADYFKLRNERAGKTNEHLLRFRYSRML